MALARGERCSHIALRGAVRPQGNGRGVLTIAIEKAQAKNCWDINLSEVATFAARKGIHIPAPRRASPTTETALAAADNAALLAFRITYNNLT
ncbi:hypothetical protein HBI56_161130 [Parastagonospora nodorum]|uniref:Uncharacterized protein n=1 Tax=Phaeosphaeria nodorum (strain SN15 / ATCC MYA-4574 / FGSC 10173) TaxID=321614 RepID=A0A7U2IA23_PHANO|nr:hypothetical protein HBH56_211580 [Parastagonospora nodorum]QRD06010.1 hypothetical protein JI435_304450 [Parastagonospora nodorum SN15]KAH3931686.1 hypothetical protein HBH54_100190 [Parastagonospora nodorum]KAH3944405.1 hypothetical protein HBH53_161660 [Parastagonospora nodorum]KAH3960681.1 hypothetical protein HBH51_189870 [Parastagonospora nodorum]